MKFYDKYGNKHKRFIGALMSDFAVILIRSQMRNVAGEIAEKEREMDDLKKAEQYFMFKDREGRK